MIKNQDSCDKIDIFLYFRLFKRERKRYTMGCGSSRLRINSQQSNHKEAVMKLLLDLFLTFARIGVMTFGGGYAMLPILQREVVETKKWATEEELMDYFAIGQCTPGIIAVNTATFVGQKKKGVSGGIIATLGIVFPSLVIISLLAGVIESFSHVVWVQNAFGGIRVCVCVLILNAVVKLFKKAIVDKFTLVIFAVVTLGSCLTNLSPVIFVLLAAAAGIILKALGGKEQ